MTSNSTVYASQQNQTVWIRVEGKGTFQTSAGLKQYSLRMIQRGNRRFVVDLSHCEVMDSTFMGTLAGIALRLREVGSGWLSVIRANARNAQLLENLGLDHLFSFDLPEGVTTLPYKEDSRLDVRIDSTAATVSEHQKAMLDAHEALVEADPENKEKFQNVIDLLKSESPSDGAES